jgi:hypothetical protein
MDVRETNETCEFWIARMRRKRTDIGLNCEKWWQKDGVCRAHGGLCSSKDIKECIHMHSLI